MNSDIITVHIFIKTYILKIKCIFGNIVNFLGTIKCFVVVVGVVHQF